jgi:putative spermidine/putrescine transport system ATP-binding protein
MCVEPGKRGEGAALGSLAMSYLLLEGLTRRFASGAGVFDLSLALERGRTLALLGPSGSGKTTTLRLLGGFEQPDTGKIVVDGQDVVALRPEQRRFGMVFQHYALFPHLDVGENVAFGLQSRGVVGTESERRVAEALGLVDLAGYERRKIAGLSGGQQQRVALARALAPEPRVLLLDEPLSNLDPALRERTRRELRGLIRRIGITSVIVTHEQEDAFDLGDTVAVLHNGRLEQIGPPEMLYRAPATQFVGGFIGRSSWLSGTLEIQDTVRVEDTTWRLGTRAPGPVGARVRVLVRPEALRFGREGEAGIRATVTDRRFAGASAFYLLATEAGTSIEISAPSDAAAVGQPAVLVPASEPADRDALIRCFPEDAT